MSEKKKLEKKEVICFGLAAGNEGEAPPNSKGFNGAFVGKGKQAENFCGKPWVSARMGGGFPIKGITGKRERCMGKGQPRAKGKGRNPYFIKIPSKSLIPTRRDNSPSP